MPVLLWAVLHYSQAHNDFKIMSNEKKKINGRILTGRLEMRLSEEVEIALLNLIGDSGRTKTDVVRECILGKQLKYHLTDDEIEIYRSFAEIRGDFRAIKNALKSRTREERLRLFRNDEFMEQWLAVVDQCIEQWGRVIDKMIDRP